MPNSQTVKDRLDEAVAKSIIDFFNSDLVTAWGGAVEIVEGTPDFDYERRAVQAGGVEPRDLNTRPLVVLIPQGGGSGPWAMSPAGGEYDRSLRFRLNLAAKDHWAILSLKGTVEAVMDGAAGGTGGITLKHPDTAAALGTIYFDDEIRLSNLFSGPGDSDFGAAQSPEGKSQFSNLKHRASMLFGINVRKPRGTAVI